jgi:hypothetical protein
MNDSNTANNVGTFHPNAFASPDPIVQLRLVCKNIVIWLRTLYCCSRMLPAQSLRKMTHPRYLNGASSPIGFCIYVVSEGQDDLSGLVTNEGFSAQSQPHSVQTPYGELGWKVFYAPKSSVKQLLPEPSSPFYSTLNHAASTQTRPIPMAPQQQTPTPMTKLKAARSAPQHGGHHGLYRRANSDFSSRLTDDSEGSSFNSHNRTYSAASPNAVAPRSYHDRHRFMHQAHKAQSSGDMDERLWLQHQQDAQTQQQNGLPYPSTTEPLKDDNGAKSGGLENTKNLSGLSLALMMSEEQSLSLHSENTDSVDDNGIKNEALAEKTAESTKEAAAAEKRRAALHSVPPQLFSNHSPAAVAASPLMKAAMTAGEYGYAYNNHIPTLRHQHANSGCGISSNPVTPNTNNTSTAAMGPQAPPIPASSSYTTASPLLRPTTPLGSTPPGYLLSATPLASAGLPMAGPITPRSVGSGGLIPPRSAVTPPFVRPMGFVGEAPSQPMPPAMTIGEAADVYEGHKGRDGNGAASERADHDMSLQQHQTSLDLLHSSPFHYPSSHSYYSMNASGFQHGEHDSSTAAAFMSDYYHRSGHLSEDIVQGRGRSNSEAFFENDLSDEMPFAVDPIGSSGSGPATNVAGNASVSASSAGANPTSGLTSMMNEASLVASMCTAAPKRLAMFDSKLQEHSIPEQQKTQSMTNMVDSLADQLADFKSFGASLNVANAAAVGGVAGSSFAPEAPTASAGSG